MGVYVNPHNMEKEDFLRQYGTLIEVDMLMDGFGEGKYDDHTQAVWASRELHRLPVVLMDNGPFTAAGIAFSEKELGEFLDGRGDQRDKNVYWVDIKDLSRACDAGALARYLAHAGTSYTGLESITH